MGNNFGKSAPVLVVLTLAGYCCWSALDGTSAGSADKRNEVPTIAPALLKPALPAAPERDPFGMKSAALVATKEGTKLVAPGSTDKTPLEKPASPPPVDLAALLRGLTLSATCVSDGGGTAIINGKLYGAGEALRGAGGAQTLLVEEIHHDRVVLRHEEQTMELVFANRSTRTDKPAPARPPKTKAK